jgi:hypothetical protein
VQQAGLVAAGLIIVLLVAGFLLSRSGVEWGPWLSVLGGMLARASVGVVFAWTAIRAAERGGLWFSAVAVVVALLAVASFAMIALMTWALVKLGPNPET